MRLVLVLLVGAALVAASGRSTRAAGARPNIVVIMADDVGYSDIGCYGGEVKTPVLDRLARGGVRFSQFYNTARCCPTRAALLTGLYPHQAGIGHMMADRGYEGYRGDLNRRCLTLAEALKPAGYAAYAAGKWHVTPNVLPPAVADQHNWPLQRGFDRFYGTIHGGGSFYDPNSLVRDNTLISPYADPEYRPKRYYYTDAISDQASRFICEHAEQDRDKPFLMYVTYTAAHWPMHAPEESVRKYQGRYDAGYDALRRERYARMQKVGSIDSRWELSPTVGDWSGVKDRAWEARCMEVYEAMLDRMDQGIGKIVSTLKAAGQFDNTLVLYLQDNGGCAEITGRQQTGEFTVRPDKPPFPPMRPDELQRDMIPKQTRDGYPVIQGPGARPGAPDSFVAYGRGWANVSNTPFREYKHWVHEGGISSPLIAHWPNGIAPSLRGKWVSSPAHLIDVMATCVDLSGAVYPRYAAGQRIRPLEGTSLRPALETGRLSRSAPLFWEHEGNRAVRDGRWKLVAKENQRWELYDIDADRSEQHDLAAREPERVLALSARWDEWAARANVLPLGGWRGRAAQR